MGGVDRRDAHCSNLMPCIRSKNWTWVMFLQLVQASIANATVLRNMVHNKKKVGTKDIGMEIVEFYLSKGRMDRKDLRKSITETQKEIAHTSKTVPREHGKCAETVMCMYVHLATYHIILIELIRLNIANLENMSQNLTSYAVKLLKKKR